jgi:hypothetical protein
VKHDVSSYPESRIPNPESESECRRPKPQAETTKKERAEGE